MATGTKQEIQAEKARKRAEALRENLKRRKSQQKEREEDDSNVTDQRKD